MSTPAGKPFDPIRISDYAPKKVRERLAAVGERKSESDDPPDRAVKAPPELENAPLAMQPDETSDTRPAVSQASVAPLERSREDWQTRAEGGREAPDDEHRYDAADERGDQRDYRDEEPYSGERDCDEHADADEAHSDASPQDAHSTAYDVDLQRLECDLEALRREGSETREAPDARQEAGRLPPAGQLPPLRGLRRSRDTYIDGVRLPRSLEPSYVPPPPMRDHTNHLGAVQRILIACAVAAPLTYFLVYYFSATHEPPAAQRGAKLASVETQLASLPPMPTPQVREAPPAPQAQAPQAQAPQPAPQVQAPPPAPQPVPPAAPAAASAPLQTAAASWPAPSQTSGLASMPPPRAPPPPPVRRQLNTIDPDEVAVLLKQGEQFISTGDIVAARVLFERAAEAGNAKGALALGSTYDPAVLAKLGVRGIAPDVDKAREWYEKARDLGSAEALGRLQALVMR